MTDEIVFITKNCDDQNSIQLSISVNGTKYHKTVRFSFKDNFATEVFLNKYIIVSDVNESSDKIYFKPSNKNGMGNKNNMDLRTLIALILIFHILRLYLSIIYL